MRLHHLGVAVRSISDAMAFYRRAFGFRLLDGPYDDPIQRVTVCFIGSGNAGDLMYELVTPGNSPSPIDRVLARGNTSYHVCYEVPGVETALTHFSRMGALSLGPPVPAVAFGGRRIAWVLLPTEHLVELLEEPDGTQSGS